MKYEVVFQCLLCKAIFVFETIDIYRLKDNAFNSVGITAGCRHGYE